MIQLNILLFLVAFYKFFDQTKMKNAPFIQNWLDRMLLMTAYVITMATDCCQTSPKCVSGINKQLLKTARANNK